jgi:hypothetical protein
MSHQSPPTLHFSLPDGTKRLASLLQRGILIPCSGSTDLESLLLLLPGCDRDYIGSRIETIFVNGVAIDSLTTILHPGATVGLSAAMPGLAGAIFRKGGMHASLRSRPISTRKTQPEAASITVRLFNQVAADLAGPILGRGAIMRGAALARFVRNRASQLLAGGGTMTLDGSPVSRNGADIRLAALPLIRIQAQ